MPHFGHIAPSLFYANVDTTSMSKLMIRWDTLTKTRSGAHFWCQIWRGRENREKPLLVYMATVNWQAISQSRTHIFTWSEWFLHLAPPRCSPNFLLISLLDKLPRWNIRIRQVVSTSHIVEPWVFHLGNNLFIVTFAPILHSASFIIILIYNLNSYNRPSTSARPLIFPFLYTAFVYRITINVRD